MASVNKAILLGHLGLDPTVRYTKDGEPVCSFSMATSETWKDKSGEKQEKTTWHNIVIWGKRGETAGEFLFKGSPVYIEGRIEHREWEDDGGNKKQTTEIIANNMTLLGNSQGQRND